jgi:aspartate/methionine/tyrosine aminotransferase
MDPNNLSSSSQDNIAIMTEKEDKLEGGLSSRADIFLKSSQPYQQRCIKALFNQYSEDNVKGDIPMSIAENKLCADFLMEKIKSVQRYSFDVLNYTDVTGLPRVKTVLATFLGERIFGGHRIKPENLVIGPGCTGLLFQLSLLLFEENDSVLIPAPYYPAFDADFKNMGGVTTVPVWPIGEVPVTGSSSDASKWILNNISEEALNDAYERSLTAGHTPKVLLIVNPGNPTGVVYTKKQVQTAINWTKRRNIHLIVDEIYALSVYNSPTPFVSIVKMMENNLGDHVHILWGLSKDFGASGLRVGVLYSQNKALLSAFSSFQVAFQVSNIVQEMMSHILQDSLFIDAYFAQNRLKLKYSYDILRSNLEPLGIKIITPAGASIFVFVDFRILLKEHTFEGERILFDLLCAYGVVITPGESCHCQIPGFFRICFAYVNVTSLLEALRRIKEIVHDSSSSAPSSSSTVMSSDEVDHELQVLPFLPSQEFLGKDENVSIIIKDSFDESGSEVKQRYVNGGKRTRAPQTCNLCGNFEYVTCICFFSNTYVLVKIELFLSVLCLMSMSTSPLYLDDINKILMK